MLISAAHTLTVDVHDLVLSFGPTLARLVNFLRLSARSPCLLLSDRFMML